MIQKKLLLFCALVMPYFGIAEEKTPSGYQGFVVAGIGALILASYVGYKIYEEQVENFEREKSYDIRSREDKLLKMREVFINNPSLDQTKECKRILDEEEKEYQSKEKMYPSYHKSYTDYIAHRKELNASANVELTYQRVVAGEELENVLLELNPGMSYDDMKNLVNTWVNDCRFSIKSYRYGNYEQRKQYLSKGCELLRILEEKQKAFAQGEKIEIKPVIIKVPSARERAEERKRIEDQQELARRIELQKKIKERQDLIQILYRRVKNGEQLIDIVLEMNPGIAQPELRNTLIKLLEECESSNNDFSEEYRAQREFVRGKIDNVLLLLRIPLYAYAR